MQDEGTHQKFCAQEGLRFKLLADTNYEVSSSYDSLVNLGVAKLSARHTFLIEPDGIVRKAYLNVNAEKHSAGVMLIPQRLDIGAAIDDLQLIWLASDASEWENRLVWLPL